MSQQSINSWGTMIDVVCEFGPLAAELINVRSELGKCIVKGTYESSRKAFAINDNHIFVCDWVYPFKWKGVFADAGFE